MQDIEVICPSCGHRFAVLGILEGDRAVCPGCLGTCDVPGPSTTPTSPAALPSRKQAPPADPVIKPAAKPQQRKAAAPASPVPPAPAKIPAMLAIGAVAVVGLGVLFYFVRPDPTPETPPVQPAVETAPAPTPTVEPPPAPEVVEAPPAATQESPERAEMRRIATLLLQRYPLAQAGEALTLTLRNGMRYEGVLVSVDDRFVVIERDGDPVQVAVNTLVPASRARIDNAFRFQLIKDLVRVSLARRGENQ